MRFHLKARTGHPDFLDLPWDQPLEAWDSPRMIEVPRGLHRHVVRFVRYESGLYVLKELPRRYALREYEFLGRLREERVPVVDVVGVVSHRVDVRGEPLSAVLITEHLRYSLPYRLLFQRRSAVELREPMLDALVDLLARIHLVGFMWGDCSLSNTLFRRDAHRLAAYVVDVETGEWHDVLTDGQRRADLETAIERCGGELLDLQAQGVLTPDADPAVLGDELRERYDRLWSELTREEVFAPVERFRIHERLRRLNDLGYDVGELELTGEHDEPTAVRLRLQVVEPNRHSRLLRERTGIVAQDEQARVLMNDIANFGAWLDNEVGVSHDDETVTAEWLRRSYRAALARIPTGLRARREDPQLFFEALEHWHALCRDEGRDLEFMDAVDDYAETVLPLQPEEAVVADVPDEDDLT